MHALSTSLAVGSVTYLATMLDNLLAFSARAALTPRRHFTALAVAQSLAVATLALCALLLAHVLASVAPAWFGLLAVVPLLLAWRSWRRRGFDDATSSNPNVRATYGLTLALGGDNLAVWTATLRSQAPNAGIILLVFALWQALFCVLAWSASAHPRLRSLSLSRRSMLLTSLYLALSVFVALECGVWRL